MDKMTEELKEVIKPYLLAYAEHAQSPKDALESFLGDARHGCESGVFGEFIYCDDTEAFYVRHADAIEQLLEEYDVTLKGPGRMNDACWFAVDISVEPIATELVEEGFLDEAFKGD